MTTVRRLKSSAAALTLSLLLALLSLSAIQTTAQRRARQRATPTPPAAQQRAANDLTATASRPRLLLLIVVDQFRYDYLERFGDLFVQNGLRRLMREGASWSEANYDHMPTYTAPGHATTMTGTWPSENGIIANDWYDRKLARLVSNVSDPEDEQDKPKFQLFGGGQKEQASTPRRLMASTLGDELRLATIDRAKVIGISVKDRSAILPAGRHASAAYWFSTQTGNMVTTSYYFAQPPAWVDNFNRARRVDELIAKQWRRLDDVSETEYLKRAGVDAQKWEKFGNDTDADVSFPHNFGKAQSGPNFYGPLDYSPYSNDLLLEFAEQAIVNESLGQDAETDVLTLSFSSNDYVGHRYGPYSQEMMDITLRTDRQIASLLDFINARIGLQNALVAFTADHGVAPIPEHAAALKLPGDRLSSKQVLDAVKLAIKQRFERKDDPDSTDNYVLSLSNGNIYFNYEALSKDHVSSEEIERVAGDAALQVAGVGRYFTRTQLQRNSIAPADPIARRVMHGFNSRLSGDVILVAEPFKYLEAGIPATHGSPYSYDTHVPLIIMGRGLAPGRYNQAATPADIAPTLAAVLGVQAPSNATGRVLNEALTTTAATPTPARAR
ncbi:MAG TPA: alkaline phosphatase family protein [Pyrinomonadaceae bacterium]